MMSRLLPNQLLLLSAALSFVGGIASAQDSAAEPAQDERLQADQPEPIDADRDERLAKYLSGAKFIGKFTVDGKDDASPKSEEYTIAKCEKLAAKDMFRLTARIKYGDIDQEVPLDLQILWSGSTPVITLDSFWIPGMGTFSSRVLVHSGRYAGTWQHDAKGGHLFGKIERASIERAPAE
jgi:hypothetical protein